MGLILHSFLLEAILLLLTLLFYYYLNLQVKYNQLRAKGVPSVTPLQSILSTARVIIRPRHVSQILNDFYKRFKGHKISVFRIHPTQFVVSDPELVRTILVREFSSFHDRGFKVDPQVNPLEGHLFLLNGETWRTLRNKLSPTFTSGKLKGMYPLMTDCQEHLIREIEKRSTAGDVELVDLLGCFTTDVIGSCAFGYELSCMEHPDSEFRRMGKRSLVPSHFERILMLGRVLAPGLFFPLKLRTMSKEVTEFFLRMVRGAFEERLRTGVKRNDFIQLLLQLREKGSVDIDPREEDEDDEEALSNGAPSTESIKLTDELLTAQAFVFFVAGFETTATTMTYALHLLSRHPDMQERLRQEVKEVKDNHGEMTYEALKEMPFMEACVNETLRIFPPISILNRECTKSFVTRDGVEIKKGDKIIIPVSAIQNDPEHFPEPEIFAPDRFAPGAPIRPGTYMPFGDGPRVCIGKRFALVEAKMGLARILESYEVRPSEKIDKDITLNPRSFTLTPANGLWVKFTRIPQDS